jgi:hypothetical protein
MFRIANTNGRLPLLKSESPGLNAQAVAERFGLQPVVFDFGRCTHHSGPEAVAEGGFRR